MEEEELLDKERNQTMPKINTLSLKEQINIDEIRNIKETQIYSHPIETEDLTIEKLPEDTKNYDKAIKIILLGDSNVGKSSIVFCLNNEQYNNYQRKSLGLQHFNYVIKIKGVTIRMQIWDTLGQEKFDSITSNYYKNTDVAIFIYAINDLNSFNKIEQWDKQLNDKDNNEINDINNEENNDNKNQQEKNKKLIKVLIGNKKDLIQERKITYEEGKKLSEEKNFEFFQEICCNLEDEACQKNIIEINNLFDNIGRKIYKDYIKNGRSRLSSGSYTYHATNSILISNENTNNKNKENDKARSCCC